MEFRETTRGRNLLKTGVIIRGFCNGYFGRDSYEDKKILSWGEEDDRIWIMEPHEVFAVVLFSPLMFLRRSSILGNFESFYQERNSDDD